jgi:hypothetical protein
MIEESFTTVLLMKMRPSQRAKLDAFAEALNMNRSEVVRLCLDNLTLPMLKEMRVAALRKQAEELELDEVNGQLDLLISEADKWKIEREKASVTSTGLRSSEGTGAIPDPPNTRK